MRVAALYDVHGNLPALEEVLRDVRRERVDEIVVGGDVLPGPMPRETLDLLMACDIPVRFIRGNGNVTRHQDIERLARHRAGKHVAADNYLIDPLAANVAKYLLERGEVAVNII